MMNSKYSDSVIGNMRICGYYIVLYQTCLSITKVIECDGISVTYFIVQKIIIQGG